MNSIYIKHVTWGLQSVCINQTWIRLWIKTLCCWRWEEIKHALQPTLTGRACHNSAAWWGAPSSAVCPCLRPCAADSEEVFSEIKASLRHIWDFCMMKSVLQNTASWWQIPSCLSGLKVEKWQLSLNSAVTTARFITSLMWSWQETKWLIGSAERIRHRSVYFSTVPQRLHCVANLVLFHTCYNSANLLYIQLVSWTGWVERKLTFAALFVVFYH